MQVIQSDQSDGANRRISCPSDGFTLIELMVVMALMSMLVGLCVVGLDDYSSRGRLRSAMGRLTSFDHLGRTQAVCDGQPRLLCFAKDATSCSVKEPESDGHQWQWSEGKSFVLSTKVQIRTVLTRGMEGIDAGQEEYAIRIRSDGTSADYAVVLGRRDATTAAVLFDGTTGASRFLYSSEEEPLDESALWLEDEL